MIALIPHAVPHLLSAGQVSDILDRAGKLQGVSAVTGAMQDVADTLLAIGGPFAFLGVLWGGLVHTQIFHNERAAEQGQQIVKTAVYGLAILVFAPVIVLAIRHL